MPLRMLRSSSLLRLAAPVCAMLIATGCGRGEPPSDGSSAQWAAAEAYLAGHPDLTAVAEDRSKGLLTAKDQRTEQYVVLDVARPDSWPTAETSATASAEIAAQTQTPEAEPLPAETMAEEMATAEPQSADEATTPGPAALASAKRSGSVIEGPGFRIEKLPRSATNANAGVQRVGPGTSAGESRDDQGRLLRSEPIVCRSGEYLKVDALRLTVPSAAVVAQRGCTIRISNTVINAGGFAIVAQSGSDVTVESSSVTGTTGALEMAAGARVAAWASTFAGAVSRPAGNTGFSDRGGNVWQ
ncbi:MAG: hypothetical protein R3E77_13525 [Steroidobacteraceae bacterium]